MSNNNKDRRKFLTNLGLGLAALGVGNVSSFGFAPKPNTKGSALGIGWITDLHHGFAPDAQQRLQEFINEASKQNLDFILQVGGGLSSHSRRERMY